MSPTITIAPKPSVYTSDQVKSYAERIGLDTEGFKPDLQNLARVISSTHEVDTSPDAVYERMVVKKNGGSWCCGTNGLLLLMLRGLGYRGITVPSRVDLSPPSAPLTELTFFTHIALIVQLDPDNALYLVDVGFGGNGPHRPIPLIPGAVVPGGAPPEEIRITRFVHPQAALHRSHPEDDVSVGDWALSYRCPGSKDDWEIQYTFSLMELAQIPNDWEALAQWLSAHPPKLFSENVMAIKFFLVDGDENKVGRLVMIGHKTYQKVGNDHTAGEGV
ncbi:hypothetical protein Clacol_009637 [Clathrus columnatus]|uniref:Arylamine N-acetyltransferase n=1 Tax=Clathrus columnatus TaxID=1419009 RepID=A0AAV5AL28_9AGAM|nr:hypothetical protein Clacol_009637 [Clathrus columnatus]